MASKVKCRLLRRLQRGKASDSTRIKSKHSALTECASSAAVAISFRVVVRRSVRH